MTTEGDRENETAAMVSRAAKDVEASTGNTTKEESELLPAEMTETVGGERRNERTMLHENYTHDEDCEIIAAEEDDSSSSQTGWMFFAMCMLQMLTNFDSGILPATLGQVQASFDPPITDLHAGFLGSLVYIGLMFSCPLSGYLLTVYKSQRSIICGAILLNAISVLAMALSPSVAYLNASRFLIGFLQAPIFIYGPVWVDEFAPPESMTLWVSLLQVNVAVGIMLGYLFGGLAVHHFGRDAWRTVLIIQFVLLCPFVLVFMCVKRKYFNVTSGREKRLKERMRKQQAKVQPVHVAEEDGRDIVKMEKLGAAEFNDVTLDLTLEDDEEDILDGSYIDNEEPPPYTVTGALFELMHCRIWLRLTFALAALYWVVTGIQFWITKYMLEILNADPQAATIGFTFASITGPTAGVFFGGYIIDRLGGYKDESGEAALNTIRVCCWFGVGAAFFAVPSALCMNFWVLLVSIWMVLFFGGALLPPVTGVSVASVPPDIRAFSTSVAMFIYTLFGYAAAPLVCGLISSSIGGKDGLKYGFQINQGLSGVAVLFMIAAYFAAKGELSKYKRTVVAEAFDDSDCFDTLERANAHPDNIQNDEKLEDVESYFSNMPLGSLFSSVGSVSSVYAGRSPRVSDSYDSASGASRTASLEISAVAGTSIREEREH